MTNIKTTTINKLPAAVTPLTGNELIPIYQNGKTAKVAVSSLPAQNVETNVPASFQTLDDNEEIQRSVSSVALNNATPVSIVKFPNQTSAITFPKIVQILDAGSNTNVYPVKMRIPISGAGAWDLTHYCFGGASLPTGIITDGGIDYVEVLLEEGVYIVAKWQSDLLSIVQLDVVGAVTPPAIAAPIALAATNITQTSFQANWTAVSGATGYVLTVTTDIAGNNPVLGYNNLSVIGTTQAVTGLSAGTQYYYTVKASNLTEQSVASNRIDVLTESPILLPAPTGLSASKIGYKTNTISWDAVAGATGYRLYQRAGAPVGTYTQVADVVGTSTKVTGLTQGNDYNYKVEAYDSAGASPQSGVFSVRTKIIGTNRSFGDSYTNSVGDIGDGYIEKWVAEYAFTNVNLAESARGFFRAAKAANGLSPNATDISIMAGLNDIRRAGNNLLTIAKLKACLRSILCKHWRATALPPSNSAFFSRSGFPNTYFSGYDGEFASSISGLGVFTSAPADWLSTNIAGSTVVVGYFGTSGDAQNNFAPFDIYIDNAVGYVYTDDTNPATARTPWLTVTPNGQADGITDGSDPNPTQSGTHANARVPAAAIITDIPFANSVVKIQSRATGSNFCVIDWVGTLVPPTIAKEARVFQLPYLPPAGYAISPNLGTNAAMDAASAALQDVLSEFLAEGYPARYIPLVTHNGKILAADYSAFAGGDNIHPTNYQDMLNDIVTFLD